MSLIVILCVWIYFIVCVKPESHCGNSAYGRRGEITSPNYPNLYSKNLDCEWIIHVPDNETITIQFLDFKIDNICDGTDESYCDYLDIHDGPTSESPRIFNQSGFRTPAPVLSSSSVVKLFFHTSKHLSAEGFRLTWRVTDKFTIYSSAMSWHEASEGCLKEGGHLAVFSDITLPYLSNYLSNISDTLWIGHYLTPWIWLKGCYTMYDRNFISIPEYHESKENQAKVCQENCKDYVYFGLQEYKCFCLANLDLEAFKFVSSANVCEIQCPGNTTEICGGNYSVTMYMNDICWKNSSRWNHKVSRTISGLSCQKWISDKPHAHLFHSNELFSDGSEVDALNYCRDPDGKGAPWCFTTDPAVPWQFCDVPPCEGTCWQNPSKYMGTLNTTISGYTCKPWTDTPPEGFNAFREDSMFPDTNVDDASNNCRSPDSNPSLWCYVNSNETEAVWDYCGSPPCFGNRNYQESEDSLCCVYWATDTEFFSKKHSCSEKEHFACFINVLHTRTNTSKDTFIQAVSLCRRHAYSLANYMLLFGDSTREDSKYWIGNFRAKDNVSGKDATPTPSLCYAARHNGKRLLPEFQESCDDKFGFVCQKGRAFHHDILFHKLSTCGLHPAYVYRYFSPTVLKAFLLVLDIVLAKIIGFLYSWDTRAHVS